MAGHGSKTAVYTAIAANGTITVVKFVGYFLTGSGAILSEAIHSAADIGNQALLAVGMKRSQRPPDDAHPFGYGREAFVWSLISAVGILFLGSGVTIMHGLHTLSDGAEHSVEGGTFGLGVLVFSLVVEGGSMAVAVKGLLGDARGRALGLMEHLRTTDDPFGVAVLLEDGAAVLGVLIALAAVALTERTHVPTWDAAGSIGVGLLLGVLATFLIAKNRTLLIGRSVQPAEQEIIRETLDADPAIDRVEKQRAVVTGSDEARISVKVVFDGAHLARTWLASQDVAEIVGRTRSADELTAFLEEFGKALTTLLGREIDRIEARLRERVPRAKKIDIEPH